MSDADARTDVEVSILLDGTRLDTPAKVRWFVAKLLMERAGVFEEVNPVIFEDHEQFMAWSAEFTRRHPAAA